jgi:hypothetical protein
MLSFTLRQLLDSVGYTNPLDAGNNLSTSKNLLKIDTVRSATKKKISDDFATDQMADLTINISNAEFTRVIYEIFRDYISEEEQVQVAFNPTLVNKKTQESDALINMLTRIKNFTRSQTVVESSSAGIQFSNNIQNYTIVLTDAEVAAMEDDELAILGAADITPDLIIPESSVFMADKQYDDRFGRTDFPTYTGVDMRVLFMTPHVISKNITVKVLSYSMHSGLIPVSTLGRKRPKGFAEGDTTIAGTIISTITINDPLFDMQPLNYGALDYAKRSSDVWRTYLLPDQFPLFDIVLLFTNEHGFTSSMAIFGVKLTDVGSVMSMSDSEIEVTYTYTAMDIDLLRSVAGEMAGDSEAFDILENNEYLARRKIAYDGKSEHRDHFEIGSVYGAIDTRLREFGYNKMRMEGYSLLDIYNTDHFERNK